ncbi:MAG: hypothetical protein AVDCRST_MAG85-1371 [uncultured Solirubrobacteraceae bacterium]|uniref:Uncharacterized protein n=1 Tax=uncultured Solirubrobacteraceae bacterium TaxID=1162706 RepID=A0A6J4SAS5_9ACTN|nr:MAG: hypothetical protein AVDCRST_MAG85-1371 [uncultured Solirubrobacteraceae bacterium]
MRLTSSLLLDGVRHLRSANNAPPGRTKPHVLRPLFGLWDGEARHFLPRDRESPDR